MATVIFSIREQNVSRDHPMQMPLRRSKDSDLINSQIDDGLPFDAREPEIHEPEDISLVRVSYNFNWWHQVQIN